MARLPALVLLAGVLTACSSSGGTGDLKAADAAVAPAMVAVAKDVDPILEMMSSVDPSERMVLRTSSDVTLQAEDLNYVSWTEIVDDRNAFSSYTPTRLYGDGATEKDHWLEMNLKFSTTPAGTVKARIFKNGSTTGEEITFTMGQSGFYNYREDIDLDIYDYITIDLYTATSNIVLKSGSKIAFGPVEGN